MTRAQAKRAGIAAAMGGRLAPGDVFAHPSDKYTHDVVDVRGGEVVGRHGVTGETVTYPAAECFDPNRAVEIALSVMAPRVELW